MRFGVARFLLTVPLIRFFRSGAITGYQRRSELQSGCQQQLSKSLSFFFFFFFEAQELRTGDCPFKEEAHRAVGCGDILF